MRKFGLQVAFVQDLLRLDATDRLGCRRAYNDFDISFGPIFPPSLGSTNANQRRSYSAVSFALCCVARHCDCALTGVRSAVLCPNWGARGSVEVIKHPFFKSLDVGKMRDLAVPSPFAQLVHPEGDVGHLDLPKEPLVWDDPKGGDDYGATFDAF